MVYLKGTCGLHTQASCCPWKEPGLGPLEAVLEQGPGLSLPVGKVAQHCPGDAIRASMRDRRLDSEAVRWNTDVLGCGMEGNSQGATSRGHLE